MARTTGTGSGVERWATHPIVLWLVAYGFPQWGPVYRPDLRDERGILAS